VGNLSRLNTLLSDNRGLKSALPSPPLILDLFSGDIAPLRLILGQIMQFIEHFVPPLLPLYLCSRYAINIVVLTHR
jgi:hypothetical protein